MNKRNSGFTLVEVVVVLAVVAILAAILTPNIVKNIKDSKIARAANETQVVAAALASFYKDLGRWPTSNGSSANHPDYLYRLFGDGAVPSVSGTDTGRWNDVDGRADTFANHLIENDPKDAANNYPDNTINPQPELKWSGPYIIKVKADPWGNSYVCNISYTWYNGGNTNAVCVITGGSDRTINSEYEAPMSTFNTSGDDLVTRLQ